MNQSERAIVTILWLQDSYYLCTFLVCFCWVFEVSDKECREVRPDYGNVLVGKPCQKQCGASFCWFKMVILMQEHQWNIVDSTYMPVYAESRHELNIAEMHFDDLN